jgi:hypothetical protein
MALLCDQEERIEYQSVRQSCAASRVPAVNVKVPMAIGGNEAGPHPARPEVLAHYRAVEVDLRPEARQCHPSNRPHRCTSRFRAIRNACTGA